MSSFCFLVGILLHENFFNQAGNKVDFDSRYSQRPHHNSVERMTFIFDGSAYMKQVQKSLLNFDVCVRNFITIFIILSLPTTCLCANTEVDYQPQR